MTLDNYSETLDWALARGLQLHEGVFRHQHQGVWGMFTDRPIAKGTVLARFARSSILNPALGSHPESLLPKDLYCYAAALEYMKARQSEYWGLFAMLEDQAQLDRHSCYFFSVEELSALQAMSALLHLRVQEFIADIDQKIARIRSADSSIPAEVIALIELNMQSRAWDDAGFLPVLDLFNHSDVKGMTRKSDTHGFFLTAGCDYQAGEQLFMSYSQKDMYEHAINYNYFDPGATHFINFGYRFIQSAGTEFERKVLALTLKKNQVDVIENGGGLNYRLLDQKVAFTETRPTPELLEYFKLNAIQNADELKQRRASNRSVRARIDKVLSVLQQTNRIDAFRLEDCPSKLQRFWHLLQKEKTMLDANQDWVKKNL